MSRDGSTSRICRGRRQVQATGIIFAACLALFGLTETESGATPGEPVPGRVVLGETADAPDPACPIECRAIGSVSGFQVSTEGPDTGRVDNLPYRVPFRRGRVTAWTLDLAQPTNSQKAFFNGTFGQPPQARIGVLRKVRGSAPPRYILAAQSPVKVLTQFFGRRANFRLKQPLEVRRSDMISLTVPTWAPAFAIDIPDGNEWRASRNVESASTRLDQRLGRPHQVLRSRRNYSCRYEEARLLYTATVTRRR